MEPITKIEVLDVDDDKNIVIPSDLRYNIIELAKNYDRIIAVVKKLEEEKYNGEYDNGITIELPLETVKDYRQLRELIMLFGGNLMSFARIIICTQKEI